MQNKNVNHHLNWMRLDDQLRSRRSPCMVVEGMVHDIVGRAWESASAEILSPVRTCTL